MEKIKAIFKKEDSFFSLNEGAKRRTHVFVAILALIIIFVLTAISSKLLTLLFFEKDSSQLLIKKFTSAFFHFTFFILFTWLFIKFFEKRSFRTIGFIKDRALKQYSKGFLIGFLLVTTSFLFIGLFSDVKIVTGAHQPNVYYSALTIFIALLFFIVQGASEEIVFRGWFMQTVGSRHWPWLGFLLSIIIFSAVHLPNAGIDVLAFLNIALIATFLSVYVIKEKSLWGACGIHTSWNWVMGNVFGLNVSGNESMGDSIVNLSLTGNKIYTGGKFGLEGSIIVTIVIIAAITFEIGYRKPVKYNLTNFKDGSNY